MSLFGTTTGYFEYPIPAGQARTVVFPFEWQGAAPDIVDADVVMPDDIIQPSEVTFDVDIDGTFIVSAVFTAEQTLAYNGARIAELFITIDGEDDPRLVMRGYLHFYTSARPPQTVGAEPFPIMIGDTEATVRASLGGPQGEQGPAGGGGGATDFVHTQVSASDHWVANHNLGYFPNIEVRSVGGVVIDAAVTHTSVNQFVVDLNVASAGTARSI